MEWLIFIIGVIAFTCLALGDRDKPKKKPNGHYSARSSQLRALYSLRKIRRMKF